MLLHAEVQYAARMAAAWQRERAAVLMGKIMRFCICRMHAPKAVPTATASLQLPAALLPPQAGQASPEQGCTH